MANLIEKLMQRWGVDSYGKLLLILFIFSITGITTLIVKEALFSVMGIEETTAGWVKALAWLLTVLPAYQVLFLFFGFIFGQFEFVWRFEKKSANRIKTLFYKTDQPEM